MDMPWWPALLFLPLFPFSIVFVLLIKKLPQSWLRSLAFLLWAQPGVWLLGSTAAPIPDWILYWALATAFLYAYRALVIRELNLWLSYIAVSAWSILWIVLSVSDVTKLMLFALGFSLPMSLMALLGGELERRFQAAYGGLYGGIARSHPRLSAMLVFTLLAVIATPLFPGFFTMMSSIMAEMLTAPPIALGLLLVWLLWSWSGILLLQGLVMGPAHAESAMSADLDGLKAAIYTALLIAMVLFGLQLTEVF
ncbi:MAG: hypothetical protein QNJ69_03080 [Gammaproteobacteria bacterium]|nr:hypothetical protein [Gammaproteobacteria bacterium]